MQGSGSHPWPADPGGGHRGGGLWASLVGLRGLQQAGVQASQGKDNALRATRP